MRTPVVVVTGLDDDAMARTMIGLLWDLWDAVAVQHRIDPNEQVVTRVVSDASGELERERIPLEHACTSCALREDVMPTLERLAKDGRWGSVVTCLPVGAEADQIGRVMAADGRLARHLRLSSVVTALAGADLEEDLLGEDLLCDRDRHTGPDDDRGHGEVACAMVEYADVVTVTHGADPAELDLVHALKRPDALVVEGGENLVGALLLGSRHDHDRTTEWASPLLPVHVPRPTSTRVWQLDLSSLRPLHPGRLLEQIGRLGGGRHRSRGSFWVPTRPALAQVWDGAGGQLSIGSGYPWRGSEPRTRLLITGVGAAPEDLIHGFDQLLATPEELQHHWVVAEDGLEPWLGPIRDAA